MMDSRLVRILLGCLSWTTATVQMDTYYNRMGPRSMQRTCAGYTGKPEVHRIRIQRWNRHPTCTYGKQIWISRPMAYIP
jgi:hypothetical protein